MLSASESQADWDVNMRYRLSSSRDVFFRIYDIIISEAQEICISGMIMMMLLTMTMKRWPEANLSPDLG